MVSVGQGPARTISGWILDPDRGPFDEVRGLVDGSDAGRAEPREAPGAGKAVPWFAGAARSGFSFRLGSRLFLHPADVRGRTGALSATLLELASGGAAPEPVHRLLGAGDRGAALADLRRLGASTGGAIAAGIARAAEYVVSATAEG